jgi:hypothetical protein
VRKQSWVFSSRDRQKSHKGHCTIKIQFGNKKYCYTQKVQIYSFYFSFSLSLFFYYKVQLNWGLGGWTNSEFFVSCTNLIVWIKFNLMSEIWWKKSDGLLHNFCFFFSFSKNKIITFLFLHVCCIFFLSLNICLYSIMNKRSLFKNAIAKWCNNHLNHLAHCELEWN